jgi:phospholipase/carboxylesterase
MSLDRLAHRVRPATSDPEGALVLLHGRGADEHDLYPLFDLLDPARRLLGVAPRGPLSLPPGGAHWYVVRRVGYPDPATFGDSFRLLEGWLEALEGATGIPVGDTVLGGFSQGAVMSHALSLGRGRPRPRALVALSGFIPTVEGFEPALDQRAGFPVAIGHGTLDPVIGVEWGRQARARLEAAGAEVLYEEAPMGHTIDPRFLARVADFIASPAVRGEDTDPEEQGPG